MRDLDKHNLKSTLRASHDPITQGLVMVLVWAVLAVLIMLPIVALTKLVGFLIDGP